jgi:hypothetical protein
MANYSLKPLGWVGEKGMKKTRQDNGTLLNVCTWVSDVINFVGGLTSPRRHEDFQEWQASTRSIVDRLTSSDGLTVLD